MSSEIEKEEVHSRERNALIAHIAIILAEEYLRLTREADVDAENNNGINRGNVEEKSSHKPL